MTRDEAERILTEWADVTRSRDDRVLAAWRAGVSKHRIHVLTGIARTTIDRIIDRGATATRTARQPVNGIGNVDNPPGHR